MKTLATSGMLALGLSCLVACEDKPSDTTTAGDAAATTAPAVDPDLAEAVAAASKRKRDKTGAQAGAESGPPPNGIFEPGKADAELARGAAPKITIGNEGTPPRLSFAAPAPAAGWKRSGNVELTIRVGRGQLPTLTTSLSLEALKAKPEAGERPGTPVLAKVTKAGISGSAVGAGELEAVVNKMKGSRVSFRALPSGATDDFSVDLAKGVAKDLDALLRPMSELLAAVTMPYPDKAVGKGGFWMVTSRETVTGVDVVTYRLVRVEAVSEDTATLSLSIKRYAATTDLSLPGVPPGAKLEQFQSAAEGKLTVRADAPLLPTSGDLRQTLVAILDPGQAAPAASDPNQQQQRLTAQTQSEAKLEFPLAGAAKRPAP